MITLTLDIGNTKTKLHWFDTEGLVVRRMGFLTNDGPPKDAEQGTPKFDRAVIGSVVPAITQQWENWALERARKVHLASPLSPWNFAIGVEAPEKVGVDRLANMEALSRLPGSALAVDAGTATKIDLLEGMGNRRTFAGGAIAPGLAIGYEALMEKAAQLKPIDWEVRSPVLGFNSETAIRSGLLHGFASLVDGMILRILAERRLPQQTPAWATGGYGRYLEGRANFIEGQRPDLTAEGLYELSKKI